MSSIAVFTGESIDSMRKDGGSGHWSVSLPRVKHAEYLVAVRNRRVESSPLDHKHGTAFLIARLSGETKDSQYAGRTVIGLSEYAEIHVLDAWKKLTDGQRFPVAYLETQAMLDQLGIDVDDLDWKPFDVSSQAQSTERVSPITQAKNQLADVLGISPDAIEISIRA